MSQLSASQRLSDEELAEMKEVFSNFDANGNGNIDIKELATILRSLGYNPSWHQLEDIMRQGDVDGDGQLSLDEFINMIGSRDIKTNFEMEIDQVRAAFNRMDIDGNGHVDRHELGEIMRAFGQKLSDEQVELMVRQADRDGDGQISCDELIKFIFDDGVDESVYGQQA